MSKIEIDISKIPQTTLDSVQAGLGNFFAPLAIVVKVEGKSQLHPIGSGTFVTIGDRSFIVTVAHVWDEIEKAGTLVLALSGKPGAYSVDCQRVNPHLMRGEKYGEWGPDMALLELSTKDVAEISAQKSFLNLLKQKEEIGAHELETEKRLWTIFGNIDELHGVQRHVDEKGKNIGVTTEMRALALIGFVEMQHDRDAFDFFDIGVNLAVPDVPRKYGGVSGAGLWQLDFTVTASAEIKWTGKRRFCGVAFWESAVQNERRLLRCHGPKSLYETAWKEWGLT